MENQSTSANGRDLCIDTHTQPLLSSPGLMSLHFSEQYAIAGPSLGTLRG